MWARGVMNWKRCRKCAVLSMAPVRWFSENTTQTCSEASSPRERRIFATAPDVLHIVSCWLLVYPTIRMGPTGMQCFICRWKQWGAADLSWFLRRKKKEKKRIIVLHPFLYVRFHGGAFIELKCSEDPTTIQVKTKQNNISHAIWTKCIQKKKLMH